MDRKPESSPAANMSWMWGAILIFLGGAALLNQFVKLPFSSTGFFWAAVFAAGGVIFYSVYLRNRANWWAQIPAYVLVMIGILIIAGTLDINGDIIGIFVMLAIAAPFYYVYLTNRERWWALIPAYVMTAVAGIIAISNFLPGDWVAVYVMFAVALPFYYVYLRNRKNWWALIPAGVMTLVGLGILISSFQYIIPIALILVGAFLLARQFRGSRPERPVQPPKSGPDADKPQAV